MAKPKSKLAYLSYDQIQVKIDAGLLDEYDLIFEKAEYQLYILDKDKNIVPVKSRIDAYQSEADAVSALNNKSDTYEGQIINVLEDGEYIPYTVNKNSSTGRFYVRKINDRDYDSLKNVPIINITANNEIILSELDNGFYTLVGSYRFSESDVTHRMTSVKKYFVVNHLLDDDNNTITHITEFSGTSIMKYICSDNEFIEDRYVLSSELENDVIEILDVKVPVMIDKYVATHEATQEDIQNLFS